VLFALAWLIEGVPTIDWSVRLALLFLYAGVFGVVIAYWAMAMVNRSLPAVTTSLGILATPVVGTLASALALGEHVGLPLLAAMALIIAGIAVGTIGSTGAAAASRQRA
jgi:drug/metabolite transporter (DMT)-like permease